MASKKVVAVKERATGDTTGMNMSEKTDYLYEVRKMKLESLVREINNTSRNPKEKTKILRLIYDYEKLNDYAKIIVDNASVCLPGYDKYRCRNMGKLERIHENTNERRWIAMEFVDWCRGETGYASYMEDGFYFLFWALMVLTVDNTEKEEKLSIICDYARMLMITDQEVKDIVELIKIIYDRSSSEVLSQQYVSALKGTKEYDLVRVRKYEELNNCIKSHRTLSFFSRLIELYTEIKGSDVDYYRCTGIKR